MVIANAHPGLRTEYHTPHTCKRCLEHIGEDWAYCPYCGWEIEIPNRGIKGKWETNGERDIVVYCNICGTVQDIPLEICPSCGARMEGPEPDAYVWPGAEGQ